MEKHFWKIFIKTLNRWLTIICAICIIFVFLMDMDYLTVQNPIKLFVAIGKLNYGIAISYIAAYVFYLITVHFVETKSSISVYTAANAPASAIVSNIYYIFIDMAKAKGEEIGSKDLNKEKIVEILRNTQCFGESNLLNKDFTKYNWIQYLSKKANVIKEKYNLSYPLYTKLDGEYIASLSEVEQVDFMVPLANFLWTAMNVEKEKPENLYFSDSLETVLVELYEKAKRLEAIIKDRNKIYEIQSPEGSISALKAEP